MTHPDFINSVENEALEQAQNTGLIDGSSKKLKMAELEYIRAWRKKNGEDNQPEESEVNNLTGFALSGGGIRSATFSLGVMQALAHRGLLKKFDYLSTVSGGGYISMGPGIWYNHKNMFFSLRNQWKMAAKNKTERYNVWGKFTYAF